MTEPFRDKDGNELFTEIFREMKKIGMSLSVRQKPHLFRPPTVVVTFDCPDDVSDDTIKDLICRYFLRLNTFHRELGGSGIKIVKPH